MNEEIVNSVVDCVRYYEYMEALQVIGEFSKYKRIICQFAEKVSFVFQISRKSKSKADIIFYWLNALCDACKGFICLVFMLCLLSYLIGLLHMLIYLPLSKQNGMGSDRLAYRKSTIVKQKGNTYLLCGECLVSFVYSYLTSGM